MSQRVEVIVIDDDDDDEIDKPAARKKLEVISLMSSSSSEVAVDAQDGTTLLDSGGSGDENSDNQVALTQPPAAVAARAAVSDESPAGSRDRQPHDCHGGSSSLSSSASRQSCSRSCCDSWSLKPRGTNIFSGDGLLTSFSTPAAANSTSDSDSSNHCASSKPPYSKKGMSSLTAKYTQQAVRRSIRMFLQGTTTYQSSSSSKQTSSSSSEHTNERSTDSELSCSAKGNWGEGSASESDNREDSYKGDRAQQSRGDESDCSRNTLSVSRPHASRAAAKKSDIESDLDHSSRHRSDSDDGEADGDGDLSDVAEVVAVAAAATGKATKIQTKAVQGGASYASNAEIKTPPRNGFQVAEVTEDMGPSQSSSQENGLSTPKRSVPRKRSHRAVKETPPSGMEIRIPSSTESSPDTNNSSPRKRRKSQRASSLQDSADDQQAAAGTSMEINNYVASQGGRPETTTSAAAAATAAAEKPSPRRPSTSERAPPVTRGTKRKYGSEKSDANWRDDVEGALREVRRSRRLARNDLLQKALLRKNTLLNDCKRRRKDPDKFPLLPYGQNGRLLSSMGKKPHPDHPLPRDNFTTIFLRRQFTSPNDEISDATEASDDSGNDADKDVDSSEEEDIDDDDSRFAAKIEEFQVGFEKIGAGYEENDADEEIDQVLERLQHLNHIRDEVHQYLAILLQEDSGRIQERFEKVHERPEPRKVHETPYEDIMSSYRDLFCRRCLTYDCNLHGLPEDCCPTHQAKIAVQKEVSGFWEERTPLFCLPINSRTEAPDIVRSNPPSTSTKVMGTNLSTAPVHAKVLSEADKLIAQKLHHIFQGNTQSIATSMGISEQSIVEQVEFTPLLGKGTSLSSEFRSKSKSNTYNPSWIKRIVETKSHPFFFPCFHKGPCSEANCTCVQNGFFCTKHCNWGSLSRNYFRGCNCTGKCTAKSCPCFASNRECDPDLCNRCGACSDPPNKPARHQPCRNDNIGMRRHVHLLVGKSQVYGAGWGLYNKTALKRGDYIHEYLGEMIPHNEAERRGAVYDERNQTYLFDLSSDYAVDALRKGNKTRFINHSQTPNISPKLMVVNGDMRIGFFAKRDIPAQTELFFDYGGMFFSSKGGFARKPPEKDDKKVGAKKVARKVSK